MNTISADAAARIYYAHREIEAAENLLKEMADESRWSPEKGEPLHKDVFGTKRYLQLGVPSGPASHKLFRVPEALAKYIIQAHIAEQRKELEHACIAAQIELDGAMKVAPDASEGGVA